jgi:hypothetical protein
MLTFCLLKLSLAFVHGLCGHRRNTWTKDGVCWPEELLSKEQTLSHVRILTFGYDANVNSLNSLFEHSINLLNELSLERRQDAVCIYYLCRCNKIITESQRDRPIIFVAHSLGGLVVKDVSCLGLFSFVTQNLMVYSNLGTQSLTRREGNQTSSRPNRFRHARYCLPRHSS